MSAVKAATDRVHEIIDALEAEGHKYAAELKSLFTGLIGAVPGLESEAKTDAADVVKTAETQGVVPAEHEAVADGEHLAGGAVADVEIAGGPTPQEQARHSALFVAVDIAKQIPAAPGETVDARLTLVLTAAERLYPWLLGPEPTGEAN